MKCHVPFVRPVREMRHVCSAVSSPSVVCETWRVKQQQQGGDAGMVGVAIAERGNKLEFVCLLMIALARSPVPAARSLALLLFDDDCAPSLALVIP